MSNLIYDLPGKDVEPDSSSGGIAQSEVFSKASDLGKKSSMNSGSEGKQIKGALPEGFFDDKEADLRAHGIKLLKPDVKYVLPTCYACIF